MKPLNVAFVWHMHQPYYKDDLTNTYLLPWVRLRSAKDYFKMPALLDAYPKVRATFNLVPSLLAQIEDYGKEDSVDLFLNISKRDAAELSSEERAFVIRWMRESPRALRVQQSPRYLELASRTADAQFTTQDMRDLQLWFNLAWCDPAWAESDPRLAELKRKDRAFAESDKEPLFEAQMEMMQKVIPKYRELADRGQAELTFSPYYHPILPLLVHVDSARTANPQIQLPERHFSHREDAERNLVGRMKRIREQQDDKDYLAVIALDGENAWEFYPRDGHDFLNALYGELEAAAPDIVTTTVGDFLKEHPPQQQLHRLHTGSWIGASLDTWIGDPDHNTAWDLLAETRTWLEEQSRQRPHESSQAMNAWREIMITEGSDWFWWFSRKHDSGMDQIWDNQFRLHLRNVYKVMGQRAPARLFQPILQKAPTPERALPQVEIRPASRDDPAWSQAGFYQVGSGFGALHRPAGVVERVFYGNDAERLYVRIDTPRSAADLAAQNVVLWLYCSGLPSPDGQKGSIELPLAPAAAAEFGFEPAYVIRIEPRASGGHVTLARVSDPPQNAVFESEWDAQDPFFLSVPFAQLGRGAGEPVELALIVSRDGHDIEQVPPNGSLGLRVPGVSTVVEAEHGKPLKVLVVAAELAPFAKMGGIADVAASLSKELRRLGHDVRAVLPRYRQVDIAHYGLVPVVRGLQVPLGTQPVEATIYEGRINDMPVYFVDCPQLYDRDSMYGFGDDDARFIYFSRAVLEMLGPLDFRPDVIHLHDWQAGLVPNLLDRLYGDGPLSDVATALTIHNLSAQGAYGFGALTLAGLEKWGLMRVGIPGLDDVVNVLGRGIHFADVVNTVSERYAAEIQRPEFGEGLDEVLRANVHKLYGIVNGIDYEQFDPGRDPNIPHHYSATAPEAKALDRAELRIELGLERVDRPLCAMVSRFYDVKGLDLVEQALPAILGLGLQIVVIGTGDRRYEDLFRRVASEKPGTVAAVIGFDPALAQRIYAGADMLWMPSRFEPCGLAQLIALRYGTVPVVRATGGLADTIKDYDPVASTGNGFSFEAYDPWQFFAAVVRAWETYRHHSVWSWLVRRSMSEDVSWSKSAQKYLQLYRSAIANHRERRGIAALEG